MAPGISTAGGHAMPGHLLSGLSLTRVGPSRSLSDPLWSGVMVKLGHDRFRVRERFRCSCFRILLMSCGV
jgi:hypothetical protein